MDMDIRFPGGLTVEAAFKGFTVTTDQPLESGGMDTAPSPFDLFLASLGTCAGFYALRFCQQRNLDPDGLGVRLHTTTDPVTHRVTDLRLEIQVPEHFPAKYRDALIRAVDQCAVKRHIVEPPRFEVVTVATPKPAMAGVAEAF
jgi:ribosomal protein S12 methylthiotransferase accessory factor